MSERVEWITDSARFESLREEWDRLARAEANPFARHGWYAAWWDAFAAGRALNICTVWRGRELAAVFPLCRARGRLESMSNTHSPIFAPFAVDDTALDAAVVAATGRREAELWGLPEDGVAYRKLVSRSPITLPGPRRISPLVSTGGDPSAYRARMKARWRELERRRRKLLREHAVEVLPIVVPADLDEELERGLRLEASGWKGRRGTAILSTEGTRRFYRSMARAFHDTGELRLSGLRVDGRLVAFDLALVHARRYWLLKTGFDEAFRSLGPGLALRLWVIERCFETGLDGHEFLGGNQEWKQLFATGVRHERALHVYAARPGQVLRYGYRAHVRPRLKSIYREAATYLGGSRALPR